MRTILLTFLFGVFLGSFQSPLAQATVLYKSKSEWFRLELRGYVKNFLSVQTGGERFLPSQAPNSLKNLQGLFNPKGKAKDLQKSWDKFRRELGTTGTDLMRIRSQFKLRFGDDLSFQLAYEIRPSTPPGSSQLMAAIPVLGKALTGGLSPSGEASFGQGAFSNFDDRYLDFPRNIFNTHSFRLDHEIDRFFVSWSLDAVEVTLGRQSMLFGVGQIFRPTDVLTSFSPQEIDKQERRGVDGLKLLFPIGELSELMVVGVVQRLQPSKQRTVGEKGYLDDFSPGGIVRFKSTLFDFDFFVMSGYIQQDLIAGAGFSGSILGAGFWSEAVYRYRLPTVEKEANPNGVFNASIGISYNLASKVSWLKLILSAEYFHNGAGTTLPNEYLDISKGYRFQRGEFFSVGSDYVALSLRWEAHPLLTLSAFGMLNLHDTSFLFAPNLEFSIKQDVSLFVSAYFGVGEAPAVSFQSDKGQENLEIKMKSEFGATGSMFIFGARIYF